MSERFYRWLNEIKVSSRGPVFATQILQDMKFIAEKATLETDEELKKEAREYCFALGVLARVQGGQAGEVIKDLERILRRN